MNNKHFNSHAISGSVLVIVMILISIYNIISEKSAGLYLILPFMYITILNILEYKNNHKKQDLISGILFCVLLILEIIKLLIK